MTQDGLLTRLALLSIRAYQRYLSPVKGFSCPFRVIAGGDSCSAYGYRVIQRHGLGTGLQLLRRRLRQCGDVCRLDSANRNLGLRHQGGFCEPSCDCDVPCDGPSGKQVCSCLGDLVSCDFSPADKKKNGEAESRKSRELAALQARVAAAKRRQAEEDQYLRKTRGEPGSPTTDTTRQSGDR